MKKKQVLSLLFLVPFLFSCGTTSSLKEGKYVHTLKMEREDFKILQFSDIHWCLSTNIPRQIEYMNLLVKEANPDFIVITGDALFTATKPIAERLYTYIDSLNIPYGVVYGNHDMQGMWSTEWMNENIMRKNAAFVVWEDDLPGETNWVVNVEKDGHTKWQIFGFDSHSYIQDGVSYEYGTVTEEQVQWYEKYALNDVPSLGFLHIPLQEYILAEEENPEGIIGEMGEGHSVSTTPSRLFSSAKDHGMKGIFCGHDHANNWVGTYEGVALGYGMKCGRELYYGVTSEGYDMTGGALYTLHENKSFQIEHIFLDNSTFEMRFNGPVEVK